MPVAKPAVMPEDATPGWTRESIGSSMLTADPVPKKLQPVRALAALDKLRRDPHDTAQVFTIIESLSGKAPLRNLQRLRRDPGGQRLLAERPQILSVLRNRAALEALPEGSLGRAYVAFLDSEGITADGLVEASMAGVQKPSAAGSELEYMQARLRDVHDLWHTVTGFQGDVLGEAALLAFNVAQLRNPGVALIVLAALARLRSTALTRLVAFSFRNGLRARWLGAVRWEDLLALPLSDVRARLGVACAPPYVPLRMPVS